MEPKGERVEELKSGGWNLGFLWEFKGVWSGEDDEGPRDGGGVPVSGASVGIEIAGDIAGVPTAGTGELAGDRDFEWTDGDGDGNGGDTVGGFAFGDCEGEGEGEVFGNGGVFGVGGVSFSGKCGFRPADMIVTWVRSGIIKTLHPATVVLRYTKTITWEGELQPFYLFTIL